ncbi:MAG TPA: Gldg family protein [Phycisphaerae bacterium]|nr:Gldg family protein [Phycisphaerae bacterium]
MAVTADQNTQKSNVLVGLNVVLMVVLAVALAAGLQWLAMTRLGRVDVTSSGINSLTEPTETLLKGLDQKITLTSLYFKTDIEDKDQDRYRSAVNDLLELYSVSNRSKVEFIAINPLQDHEERTALFKRLASRSRYKEQAAGHIEIIERFQSEFAERITTLLSEEQQQLQTFRDLDGMAAQLTGQVKGLFDDFERDVKAASQQIKDSLASDVPAHGAATSRLRQTYSNISKILENIIAVGSQVSQRSDGFPPNVLQFFVDAGSRYGSLVEDLKAQEAAIGELPALDIDQIVRDLAGATSNPILVETEEKAEVIPFYKVWPPVNPESGGAGFEERTFHGEQTVTSAILHLTQNVKPAVVFVRHGGGPMIASGNPMMRQEAGSYVQMRAQLEDASFDVYEWDLATSSEPPAMDPAPSRTIYVVDRPTQPRPNPFQQGPQDPVFTPDKLTALKKAMGDSPRALFLGGFMPAAMGAPAPNEYAEYLKDTWGIEADDDRVLLFIEPVEPGKYRFIRDPLKMLDAAFSDHPITNSLSAMRTMFPLVSPISFTDGPEGVTHNKLVWMERSDSIWSISDIQTYFNQQANEYIVPADGDFQGEFLFGATAEKGDGKIVVINSTQFATDRVAQARQLAATPQGLSVIPVNPGNPTLFINALHWLNDNAEWMNLGSPIDYSTLNIKKGASSTLAVQVFATAVWPLLAAICGLGVYFARRR